MENAGKVQSRTRSQLLHLHRRCGGLRCVLQHPACITMLRWTCSAIQAHVWGEQARPAAQTPRDLDNIQGIVHLYRSPGISKSAAASLLKRVNPSVPHTSLVKRGSCANAAFFVRKVLSTEVGLFGLAQSLRQTLACLAQARKQISANIAEIDSELVRACLDLQSLLTSWLRQTARTTRSPFRVDSGVTWSDGSAGVWTVLQHLAPCPNYNATGSNPHMVRLPTHTRRSISPLPL